MVTPSLRDIINTAIEQEALTGELRAQFQHGLPALQERLLLPDDEPVGALVTFVTRYIKSVPGCLRLVTAVSHQMGFYAYAAPFFHLAQDYFLHPPDALASELGLKGLMDEAFLAHRLMEEVNDHHIRHLQRPLLPVDMTEANIIVHHMLGDELAGRLEQLVVFTGGQQLSKEHVWQQARDTAGASEVRDQGLGSDTLAEEGLEVRLRLGS
ncbi:MAG: hypothetical protein ACI9NT_001176 [Bacteroidia bacterium]|jgi:hypothetical protein